MEATGEFLYAQRKDKSYVVVFHERGVLGEITGVTVGIVSSAEEAQMRCERLNAALKD